VRSTLDLPISPVFHPRPPLTISPCDLPGNLEAKRDALAALLATAAGVEPSAVALSIDRAAVSADITVPAEDADATLALLSVGLFARAKQFWVAAVQPVLPDGWLLMEQLHGPSYYYHEKSGASQFDKFWVAAVQPVLPDGWLLMEQLHGRSYYYHEKSGASQFDKPKAPWEPDSEDDEPYDYEPYDSADEEYIRYGGHWAGNPY